MLKDTLKKDSFEALKARDSRLVGVLRFLISLIDKKELQLPPGTMKEEEEYNVLRKELKNKEESLQMYQNAGRNDDVEQVNYEIEVVKKYLPVEMDEDEVRKIVTETVAKVGGNNFGMVMGMVMKQTQGRVGGDVVSRVVKEVLGQ